MNLVIPGAPPAAPHIGFDRFIPLAWAGLALRVRAGLEPAEALPALLAREVPGQAGRSKSRAILRGLWLEPRPGLEEFADRGAALAARASEQDGGPVAAVLCWGMAMAAYPFFGKVAESIGRLLALQGDSTRTELHRRVAEVYGERETAYRAANRVLQTQADWGGLTWQARGQRVSRPEALDIADEALIVWLIEALVRYGGRAVAVAAVPSAPALYPFRLEGSLTYLISRCPHLALRTDGGGGYSVSRKVEM